MMSAADQAPSVLDAAQEALGGLGLRVEDVRITPAGRRRVVRISVDTDLVDLDPGDHTSPVPGPDLDVIADATHAIGDALDASDALGESSYVLEVTSPGVSRPLTEPRHFRRNVGRLVDLTLTDRSVCAGRIVAAATDHVRLEVPATATTPTHERDVALHDIRAGRVQVEFAREQED